MHYLDLLTIAGRIDYSTWVSPEVMTSALDQELARKVSKKSSGFNMPLTLLIGGLCCVLVVAGVIGLIVWMVSRANNDGPRQPPYNPNQYPPPGGHYPPPGGQYPPRNY
ncbi:hypothetical protein GV794_00975 [Nocardia cyriacigeorgica]|uniref:Uncharacterized protein n=1 Tax=Nocardia cyriacigeorgica TaxID=135487 RepID=A0ABX0CCF0_9NOCA|nr:hypothetical protein [Nocardia cyriacigeorgica]NEW54245.1 hypothetical protein [Nocardia cyriacigeorgica]